MVNSIMPERAGTNNERVSNNKQAINLNVMFISFYFTQVLNVIL